MSLSPSSTKCYWPNGKELTDDKYQPCDAGSDPRYAACCDLSNSVCTEGGWCVGSSNYFYRGACTDPTWLSPSCAQSCAVHDKEPSGGYLNILDCGKGRSSDPISQELCCPGFWRTANECCNNSFQVDFGKPYWPQARDVAAINSTAGSASSMTPSSSSTSLSEPSGATIGTNQPNNQERENDSDSTTSVKVGVGVGVSIGALLLAVMMWSLFAERKKRVAAEKKMEAALAQRDRSEQTPMMTAHENHGVGHFHVSQPDSTPGGPKAASQGPVYEI